MESKWRELNRTPVSQQDMILTDDSRFEGPEYEILVEGLGQPIVKDEVHIRPTEKSYAGEPSHELCRKYRTRKFRDRKIKQADGTEVDMWYTQELPYNQRDLTNERKVS